VAKHENPRGDHDGNDDRDKSRRRRRHEHEEHRRPSPERAIFVDLLQRRMGGGATPTAQAYAKAMQQWQKLPGAVQFVQVPAFPESAETKTDPGTRKDETGGKRS
jgi:hypothetical protein